VPDALTEAGRALDKHYIPTRYPNSHHEGAAGDLYTEREARQALTDASRTVGHDGDVRVAFRTRFAGRRDPNR
jgi:HEPN domain-containing protein